MDDNKLLAALLTNALASAQLRDATGPEEVLESFNWFLSALNDSARSAQNKDAVKRAPQRNKQRRR
jgi:hypothetical protein